LFVYLSSRTLKDQFQVLVLESLLISLLVMVTVIHGFRWCPLLFITKTEKNRTENLSSMSSSYNTPCTKHKLVVSIYSNTETSLAMSTLAIWCRVVQSRDVSPLNFDGLAMSGLALSVAPRSCCHAKFTVLRWSKVTAIIHNYVTPFCYILSTHSLYKSSWLSTLLYSKQNCLY